MKLIINENPQQYYYGQTNPQGSDNPCQIPRETKQLGKGRGLRAWDLLKKGKPRFKVTQTQKEVQECCRPSFDHPKILHILIDRAAGYGSKKLAAAHGGSHTPIGKFCQSMGFDIIKPHEVIDQQPNPKRLSLEERAIKLMEEDRTSELKSIAKYDEQRHWGASDHPVRNAWMTQKRWYNNPEYRESRLSANITDEEREKRREYSKEYRLKNPEKGIADMKRWKLNNPERYRELRRRFMSKPINRIRCNLRRRLRDYLKSSGANWSGFGCSSDELKSHLEAQFTKRMTWDNYGKYWHVDHIRPVASFDISDAEQRAVNHYTNLQPLEAKKNLAKSDNWDGQHDFTHELL